MVSPAFEHMLMFGDRQQLTDEQLARAIRLDPTQIKGLGASIDGLLAMLLERKRRILETYQTESVQREARHVYRQRVDEGDPPDAWQTLYQSVVAEEQIYDLERLWYSQQDERSDFARHLVQLMETLGNLYQIDELAADYDFSGQTALTIPLALEIKEELKKIDELIEQLKKARETAQIALIDMEALAEFAEPGQLDDLSQLQQRIEDYLKEMAERQGLQQDGRGYQLTPHAYRLFQSKLLERIFSNLQASRSGRHRGDVMGHGAVELPETKPYEFGDSVSQMDIPQTLINTMVRSGTELPLALQAGDIEVHKTRNNPKCATVVIMDMSGSMRYDGQYTNVKRMALALDGLIRKEYPGDSLHFIQMATFAKPCASREIINLLPQPVTIHDPIVRYKVDMSQPEVSEYQIPPHFTNIQHSLQQARQFLAAGNTVNRQIILITDGLPTAHFDESWLYLLYPPDPLTEEATMRESHLCQREGITINMFLVPSWSQSEADIQFAYRIAEATRGRVFFTAGNDLDRYVVWDYVQRKREIIR